MENGLSTNVKVETITSLEVSQMMEIEHKYLLKMLNGQTDKDGRDKMVGIIPTLLRGDLPLANFFIEDTYKDASGKKNKMYHCTKKGCDLLANKLTGEKGILFTAKYVERFHQMEDYIKKQIPELPQSKAKTPNLASANNTVKILGTLMEKAGIKPDIQLLTAKTVYAQAGIEIPLLIEADQKYYDTTYIAKKVGMYVKKSGKPAVTAVSQLIKSLPLEEGETKDFFEGKDNWQGSVTKYSESVIEKVRDWLVENGYPTIIEGESKNYHVVYDTYDVA